MRASPFTTILCGNNNRLAMGSNVFLFAEALATDSHARLDLGVVGLRKGWTGSKRLSLQNRSPLAWKVTGIIGLEQPAPFLFRKSGEWQVPVKLDPGEYLLLRSLSLKGEHCYGSCGVNDVKVEVLLETGRMGNEFFYSVQYAKIQLHVCCLVVDDTPMYRSGLDVHAEVYVPQQDRLIIDAQPVRMWPSPETPYAFCEWSIDADKRFFPLSHGTAMARSWYYLLQKEMELERKRLRAFTMYHTLLPFDLFKGRGAQEVVLHVESHIPGLAIGDRVRIRSTSLREAVQIDCTVTKVARAGNRVKLYLVIAVIKPGFLPGGHRYDPRSSRFHVTFHTSELRFILMAEALETINRDEQLQQRLLVGSTLDLTAREAGPHIRAPMATATPKLSKLFDEDINSLQESAVTSILTKYLFHPFIVFGPPGTGKTKTLIEALLQILHRPRDRNPIRILASAPSDAACDLICHRVALFLEQNSNPSKLNEGFTLVRLNASNRDFDFVSHKGTILRYCAVDSKSGLFGLPVGFMNEERVQNRPLLIISTPFAAPKNLVFDYIFLDESSQANVLESLVLFTQSKQHTNMVLLGDPCQLGPLANQEAFGQTLHENIQRHYMSYNNTKEMYLVKLLQNYRSESRILGLYSMLYYQSELQACSQQRNDVVSGIRLIGHVGGSQKEYVLVSTVARQLLKRFSGQKVCCIAPYIEEVVKLRKQLRADGLSSLNAGSVHDFQGQEREVVIFSTHGVQANHRLVNVAVSRAKVLLVIIGNTYALSHLSRDWVRILRYCEVHGETEGRVNSLYKALDHIRGLY